MNTDETRDGNPLRAACILAVIVVAAVVLSLCCVGCAAAMPGPAAPARWVQNGPVAVFADPAMPPAHRAAVDAAVEEIDAACQCRLLLRPQTGAPILRQEVPGAPDRGTIYVRDDGRFNPTHASTYLYLLPDGRILSAEIALPLEGVAPDGVRARPLSSYELLVAALHEIGHAVGMPHSTDPWSVFYPSSNPRIIQRITPVDADELRHLYGGKM